MAFLIDRGFAERQILKKWKWPYLLNWVEYFDKRLHKYWYWQDLALGMVTSRPDSLLASAFRTHAMYARSDKGHLLLKALLL